MQRSDVWFRGNTCRLNTCPFQGSRTIRTEEAIIISLSRLSPVLVAAHSESNDKQSKSKVEMETKEILRQIDFTDAVSSEESD